MDAGAADVEQVPQVGPHQVPAEVVRLTAVGALHHDAADPPRREQRLEHVQVLDVREDVLALTRGEGGVDAVRVVQVPQNRGRVGRGAQHLGEGQQPAPDLGEHVLTALEADRRRHLDDDEHVALVELRQELGLRSG